ncbi:hypothetical protein HNQ79_005423 [Streptomyces candidus]|uniref:Uncharacterized protein n=1 Tax=Streptomyces candidus TaxID=67283 RepID=A0A7X0HJS8_9ACTN|nr:hypothetical protein [Streptomyces candidus]GHH44218.1 hypothetical protein GCM10018773_31470 [Streptomyces candidus]
MPTIVNQQVEERVFLRALVRSDYYPDRALDTGGLSWGNRVRGVVRALLRADDRARTVEAAERARARFGPDAVVPPFPPTAAPPSSSRSVATEKVRLPIRQREKGVRVPGGPAGTAP